MTTVPPSTSPRGFPYSSLAPTLAAVDKNQVADILNEIGLLLELKGENPERALFLPARTAHHSGLDRGDHRQVEQLEAAVGQPHEKHASARFQGNVLSVRHVNATPIRQVNLEGLGLGHIFAEGLVADHTLLCRKVSARGDHANSFFGRPTADAQSGCRLRVWSHTTRPSAVLD